GCWRRTCPSRSPSPGSAWPRSRSGVAAAGGGAVGGAGGPPGPGGGGRGGGRAPRGAAAGPPRAAGAGRPAAALPPLPRTAWLEIDLDALAANLALARELAGTGVLVEPVVKADAYAPGDGT